MLNLSSMRSGVRLLKTGFLACPTEGGWAKLALHKLSAYSSRELGEHELRNSMLTMYRTYGDYLDKNIPKCFWRHQVCSVTLGNVLI